MDASKRGRILLIDDDPALGGYLTRVLTRAGGNIEIYSEPGLGTTVSVLLPVTDAEAMPAVPAPARPAEDRRGSGQTILLVEDEASLRDLASRILIRGG